ncbi:MAG TPA: DNA polymerase III subunit gamma/tau, partial [Clostridiales bacterium]|nr:DNA polymerase III subunit gamma/tau [Clostridiales bacterium]
MYQALYRSYRPETFQELLGQEHIVRILKNQLDAGTTGHAYLFCGTRGTGKTSTARILAKGLNCLAPQGQRPCGECAVCRDIAAGIFVDVIEIDAASNNGVDNIRELRESVNYPPASGRSKVYVIDEAHMLSTPAANALLKTLEEPPENIVFILATTEPQKLPATILSRCLRLDFHRVSEELIRQRFTSICQERGIKAHEDALALIASNADGSVRDGLSLLDRCAAGAGAVTREVVLELLGMCGQEVFLDITQKVMDRQVGDALLLFDSVLSQGKEVNQFVRDWVEHFRSLLIIKYVERPEHVLNLSVENIRRLQNQADRIPLTEIKRCIIELSAALTEAKWSPKPRVIVELAIVRIASAGEERPAEAAEKKPTATETIINEAKPKAPEESAAPQPRAPEPAVAADPKEMAEVELWRRVMEDERISKMARTCGSVLREISDHIFTVQIS